jgi:hypothetical protein
MLFKDPYGNVKFNRDPWLAPSVRKPINYPAIPYQVAPNDEDYNDYDLLISTTQSPVFVRSTSTVETTTNTHFSNSKFNTIKKNYNGVYSNTNSIPVYSNNNYNSPLFIQPSFPESQPPRKYSYFISL